MCNSKRFSTPSCWRYVFLGLLLGYGIFLGMNFAPVASGADSGGYLNSARLLAQGRFREPLRVIPELPLAAAGPYAYVPLGYVDEKRTGFVTPTYPVGLPLHYAIAGKLLGWHWGTLLVGVFGALAAIAACYLCLRELDVSRLFAFTGAAILAVSPMFIYTSVLPLSDTIATTWVTIAVLGALKARRAFGWAILAGAAFSIAVLVRPTNVLLLPALLLMIWNWRGWTGLVLGGIPGGLIALFYNFVMYGSPVHTGYGPIFEAFSISSVWPSFRNYAATLPNVLPISLLALLLIPFLPWRTHRREIAACVLWLVSYVGVYALYEVTAATWWYLRFITPAFPAITILAMLALERTVQRFFPSPAAPFIAALVLTVSLASSVGWCRAQHVLLLKTYQHPYVAVTEWARKSLPPDTPVFCFHFSSAFYFYTELPILRYDMFSPEEKEQLFEAAQRTGKPLYAAVFPFDWDNFIAHVPGTWRKVADVEGAGIWLLDSKG